ncbi:hypothetical protein ABEW81_19440 [Priestia megaterium]
MALGISIKGKGILKKSLSVKPNSTEVIFWDEQDTTFKFLPNDTQGVYIVYGKCDRNNDKEEDKIVYVGETGDSYRIRFQKHEYRLFFVLFATKIKLIKFSSGRDDERVFYEKAKILDLEPILNKPRTTAKNKRLDQFREAVANNSHLNTLLNFTSGTDEDVDELIKKIKKGQI